MPLLLILLLAAGIFTINPGIGTKTPDVSIPVSPGVTLVPEIVSKGSTADVTPIDLDPSAVTTTVIYASYGANDVLVGATNIDGSNTTTIAKLPREIKFIRVLDREHLIFIGDTDEADRGKEIVKLNIPTAEAQVLVRADGDWKIDNYLLSPDKTYLAWWEIKPDPGFENLHRNFASRVYIAPINNPEQKVLVTDEHTGPGIRIHLPKFFDKQNRLYLDAFEAEQYAFYLGLFRVGPNGGPLEEVPELGENQYNSDPVLSPDGKFLLFTDYDSSAPVQLSGGGSGSARKEAVNRNRLVIYDLETETKETLLGSGNGNLYAHPYWSHDGQKVAFEAYKIVAKDDGSLVAEQDGIKSLDLATRELIDPDTDQTVTNVQLLGFAYDNTHLVFVTTTAMVGSLGPRYSQVPEEYLAVNLTDNSLSKITIVPRGMQQFVSLAQKSPGDPLAVAPPLEEFRPMAARSLQLGTFKLKALVRSRSNPRTDCINDWQKKGYPSYEACEACPIYIYTDKTRPVHIETSAKIFNANIKPQPDGWRLLAREDGTLVSLDGQQFSSLRFDLKTKVPTRPTNGWVVSQNKIEEKLVEYAKLVGLEGKELDDFISFWQENLPSSPYYFISHFTGADAAAFLPLLVDPQPDRLVNIVFYLKKLDGPYFAKSYHPNNSIKREGYTVVSWSALVE